MRYKSQAVAYWYFAVAMLLFGLQIVFGLLSAAKYLGPDPLLYILPFDVTKVIHTNLLIVWVLTGFMGAFTTFSTFIFESGELLRDAQWLRLALNIGGQNAVGFAGLVLGSSLGRIL